MGKLSIINLGVGYKTVFIKQVFILNIIWMGCGAVQNPQASQPFGNKNVNLIEKNNNNSQRHHELNNKVDNVYRITEEKVTMDRAYQIHELLGKGTYGQVYRCTKNETGEEFALKIVKLNAKNKQQAKRHIHNLKSEISVLKKLNHPNIVKYYSFDISPDNQTVQIVFQLIQEGSLKDYLLRNGKLTESEASRFCKQILQGLDYLHSKSIIHRDLKCANILISQDRTVKITDFGTAKQIKVRSNQDIAKLCASLKGTPYYMAPQILKRAGHHKSADIWSFGCTLIEMLTGKPPWTTLTQNFQEIISYIISGISPPLPLNISKQCQFFLMSCFDVVPSQRLTARQLLNHRFILMNTKASSPSLAYEKVSPRNDEKSVVSNSSKKREDFEVTELDSVQMTRKKRYTRQEISDIRSYINTQSAFKKDLVKKLKKKTQSNMFLGSPEVIQNSEPFINYAINRNQQIEVSDPYVHSKILMKKSKKVSDSELKKVAKTAGHLKITEQNLLNWQSIEEEMVSNQISSNYDKSSMYDQSIKNTVAVQSIKNARTRTQNALQHEQIINTALAKQQRDRYLQNQKRMKQKKEDQRKKWEEELKKESQTLRQISHKFIKQLH